MLPSNVQPARTSQMLSQTVIINIDFSLFHSAVSSPHGDYGAQQLMDGCMDRWCVCSPQNCRLCLSYFYITQVWFSSSITECKALWDKLKEVPSFCNCRTHACFCMRFKLHKNWLTEFRLTKHTGPEHLVCHNDIVSCVCAHALIRVRSAVCS